MHPHEIPLRPIVIEIGLKEIYDQLVSLNTKVEVMMQRQAEAEQQGADHENRLRTLERARWPLPALAGLVSLAALVFTALAYFNR